jgi:hypothetical protein
MAGRKFTRRVSASRKPRVDCSAGTSDVDSKSRDASLLLAIEAQRRRIFQVSAIAACLGQALEDVCTPGEVAPELQNVTDAMIHLLDDAAAGLDPTVLNVPIASALENSREG